MNFYYGLVEPPMAWGFVEETDPRVHKDMVYLTREEWQALLAGQSKGLQICYYEGKVFNAEPGRYYCDEEGWHKKTDEEFGLEKANEKINNLFKFIKKCVIIKMYCNIVTEEDKIK